MSSVAEKKELEQSKEQEINGKQDEPEVDTSNLRIGMVFKNYTELCRHLEGKRIDGNSKEHTLSTWRRYFDWRNVNRKFIITEIYDVPLPKDPRGDAVYTKYIELILTLALSQIEDGVFYTTYGALYKALNMVGSSYDRLKTYDSTIDEISRADNEISAYGMWVLRSQAKAKLRRILTNALKSMQSRRLIFFSVEQAISYSKEGDELEAASDEELKYILEAQQAALKKFNYPVYEAAINSKDGNEFLRYVNKYLYSNYGICKHVQRIKIVYRRPYYMDEVVISMLNKYRKMAMEYYETRKQLNDTIVDSFYRMIKQSHNHAVDLYSEVDEEGFSVHQRNNKSAVSVNEGGWYLFDGEKFIEEYLVSDGAGKNGNDWIFKLDLEKF
jgi:hypothetical protein